MKRLGILGLLLVLSAGLYSQTGGTTVFNFLGIPTSSRQAALGGKLLAVRDWDPSLSIGNPSLLRADFNHYLSLQCVDYMSNAFFGNVDYIHAFNVGTFRFGIHVISYGNFEAYDIYGNKTGNFSAGDYVMTAGFGKELIPGKFSMGINVKNIFSFYETYFSGGLAIDVSASLYKDEKNLCLTLAAFNIGAQYVAYTSEREKMPFDIQFAVSKKLEHLPARFHFVFHHLYKWNLNYNDPDDPYAEINVLTGEAYKKSGVETFLDNAFRHFILGFEVEPVKLLSIQFAYNYDMRREMRFYLRPGAAGLSYGFCLHIRDFNVQYARVHYSNASIPNFFTLSTDISKMFNKNKSI